MKNILILLAFISLALATTAQTSAANENYYLELNGKKYSPNDTILIAELRTLASKSIVVNNRNNNTAYTPQSFQLIISRAGDMQKFDFAANPPAKGDTQVDRLYKALSTASTGDVLFIDKIMYQPGTPAELRQQFTLVLL